MIQHALDRGYEVIGVCREKSVPKLDAFQDRITIIPGQTNDRELEQRALVHPRSLLSSMRYLGNDVFVPLDRRS